MKPLVLFAALVTFTSQIHAQLERGGRLSQRAPARGTLPTTPLPNSDFEQGQLGWTGTVARYVAPALGEAAPIPDALEELRKIGGNYWQASGAVGALPDPQLVLPVQGAWYGSNVQSTIFTLLLPNETIPADELASPESLVDNGRPRRTATPPSPARPAEPSGTPLYLQFLAGNGTVELFLYPRTAAQRSWIENQKIFQLGGRIRLPNGGLGEDGTMQVPRFRRLPDGSYTEGSSVTVGDGLFKRVVRDVTAFHGMNARVKVTGLVDDFQLTAARTPLPVPVPAPPKPLWGLADTHAHPAAHLGFGGKLYHGAPEGALDDCKNAHGFKGLGVGEGEIPAVVLRGVGTIVLALGNVLGIAPHLMENVLSSESAHQKDAQAMRTLLGAAIDSLDAIDDNTISKLATIALSGPHATEGANLGAEGWWKHDDKLHHHMRDESMRRAWQGGLRLMVAHAVNNELLGNLNPKPGTALDDKSVIENQLDDIKQMASRNSPWMEIAFTPGDARRIIGQNKLAVVLGVEVDSIGNWGRESDCTEMQVEQELGRLRALGVRHLFPVHLMDSPFAGTAFYDDLFLLNHRVKRGVMHNIVQASPDIQYKAFEGIYEMFPIRLLNFAADKLDQNGRSIVRLLGGMQIPFSAVARELETSRVRLTQMRGTANALGLTGRGNFMINKMMDMGLIIDVDHMSGKGTEDTLSIAEQRTRNGLYGYPIASGHSGFRELAFNRFETSDHHKLGTEAEKPRSYVERIRDLGGIVAPITGGKDTKAEGKLVTNDAAGTSKSWAQSFLYATRVMRNRAVAIGTDQAIHGALGPRFGPRSIPGMGNDTNRANGLGLGPITPAEARRFQQTQQNNAVSYSSPLPDWHAWKWSGDGWSESEQDALTAVLLAQKGPQNMIEMTQAARDNIERDLQPVRGLLQGPLGEVLDQFNLDGGRKRIMNLAMGFQAAASAKFADEHKPDGLPNPAIDIFKGPDVQAAALSARKWVEANGSNFPEPNTTWTSYWNTYKKKFIPPLGWRAGVDDDAFRDNFNAVAVAYVTLKRLEIGGNGSAPLTRSVIGGRTFDFNLDGFAHFGMMPDFLQDLRNNGIHSQAMAPLFRSAEDYIRMWEKCEMMRTQ
jgi:microsomal dipeptidase-like Zn-dependent dipeptidase